MKKVAVPFVLAFGLVRTAFASAGGEPALGAENVQTYIVQWGDRLENVAARFGVTPEELLAANPRSAYGVKCRTPRTVELRNGERQAICGGDEPYLVAEKTLVIPVSRHALETENTQLNDEVARLRAELARVEQEREAEKLELAEIRRERDELASERGDLQSENKSLVAARAEAQGKHDELQSNLETILSRQPKQVEVEKSNPVHIALAAVITAFVFSLIILSILSCKGKKEKEFAHLVGITLPRAEDLAAKNKERVIELSERTKKNQDLERELAKQRAELDRREEEQKRRDEALKEREEGLARGQRELAVAKRTAGEKEESQLRREGQILAAEQSLQERGVAFSSRVREEEAKLGRLRGEFTDLQARLAKQEQALAVRERECEARADRLAVWELRLQDRDPDEPDGEETTSLDEGDPTFLDPPGQAVSRCLCPDCGVEISLGELEKHRAQVHGSDESQGEDDGSITCGACGRCFPDRQGFDEHRSECPKAVPHTPTLTGSLAAGTGSRPPSAGPPLIYCNACHEVFPPEEYAQHHAEHNKGLSKPE